MVSAETQTWIKRSRGLKILRVAIVLSVEVRPEYENRDDHLKRRLIRARYVPRSMKICRFFEQTGQSTSESFLNFVGILVSCFEYIPFINLSKVHRHLWKLQIETPFSREHPQFFDRN